MLVCRWGVELMGSWSGVMLYLCVKNMNCRHFGSFSCKMFCDYILMEYRISLSLSGFWLILS